MSNTKTFDEGAKILQNVDVSSMVTALALGIASAQERLDNNSVSQLIRLAETKVAGKSLLEFGFQPAFYAFDYADISASISLKMALKEEVEVDFSLAVDYKNNTTFDKDFFDQLKKSRNKSLSKNSKTQKEVALKASTSEEISINEKSFEVHKEEGSYSKVEKTKEEMRDQSSDLRVDTVIEDEKVLEENTSNNLLIIKEGGFVVVAQPYVHAATEGLLKMPSTYLPLGDAGAPDITLKGGGAPKKFKKEKDFAHTLSSARSTNGGTVVGINAEGIHRSGGKKVLEFFFDWDKYDINYGYSTGVKSDAVDKDDVTLLALLLERDPSLNITITGYTDGSGNATKENEDYNKALGTKRAEAFKTELEKRGTFTLAPSRVTIATEGEKLANGSSAKDPNIRKIKVELPAGHDYIHFNGGEITKTGASAAAPDEFVYLENDNSTGNTGLPISFKYNGKTYTFTAAEMTAALKSANNFKSKLQELYAEKYNDYYYFLHEETKVNYFIHSEQNKEVDVKVNKQASADVNKDTTKVFVSDTKNDFSKLKESSKDFKGDRSLAISGSLDVRYARQFNMSVEGNASVAARMISVPPPSGLENYIQSLTGGSNTSSN
ncbi:OmpA family protein [Tenacibaculum agarivorans]|uniref:OmpA family protein n=1 Tax=Tenacibaculum agarivorans TaxID=1908389 RepID=UPI00094BC338|nr:OmpA family protein [Tenacibaculum agarivorans]